MLNKGWEKTLTNRDVSQASCAKTKLLYHSQKCCVYLGCQWLTDSELGRHFYHYLSLETVSRSAGTPSIELFFIRLIKGTTDASTLTYNAEKGLNYLRSAILFT